MRIVALIVLLVAAPLSSTELVESFDFEHVEMSLAYFAKQEDPVIQQIAESRATQHLLTHSQRTGYYPPETNGIELTKILLSNPIPTEAKLATVETLVSYIRANRDRQASCLNEAKTYLPDTFAFANPLFITWGYDIGVSMDGAASINLAHDHFADNPEEVWFYCIHEMHHAGVTSYHPMTKIAEISSTQELFAFLRYSTFLEGTATYAAYDARERAGALRNDRDYVALTDKARMDRYRARYFEVYERMKSAPDRPLQEVDWQALEMFSDGDRLWYRVGAEMASAIDANLGRRKFRDIISQGPEAFFHAYLAQDE